VLPTLFAVEDQNTNGRKRDQSPVRPAVVGIVAVVLVLAVVGAAIALKRSGPPAHPEPPTTPPRALGSLDQKPVKSSEKPASVGATNAVNPLQAQFVPQPLQTAQNNENVSQLAAQLNDPNPGVVKTAIKKLAAINSPAAAAALARLLNDAQRSGEARMEAASALGGMSDSSALQALSQAAQSMQDPDMVKDVLDAIGSRDFSETETFFQNYLRSPTVSSELRVAAVEALAQAQGKPTDFLLSLMTDTDPEVKVAAAWALSATESSGNAGPQLIGLLQAEQDPDVRLRIYQALGNQESFDVNAVINALRGETEPDNRIAGLDALAKALRDHPTPELQTFFDQTAIAELKQLALSGDVTGEKVRSVIALIRAGTGGALAAVQAIAQESNDPKVRQTALGGLLARKNP
jgi:HEAT repeat protein